MPEIFDDADTVALAALGAGRAQMEAGQVFRSRISELSLVGVAPAAWGLMCLETGLNLA